MSSTAVSGPIRTGVSGVGNMGMHHLGYMKQVEGGRLAAACDGDPKRLELATQRVPGVPVFSHYRDLLDSKLVDAILIATPHYPHPDIMLEAFDRGIHVLCEKPVAVTVGRARKMNQAAARQPHLKFGAMFMMRTAGMFSKIREIV